MSNPYIKYYSNQIGGGLASFHGVRYQRGHGFFGRIFSGIGNILRDILPSVAKKALPSAIGFAQDIIEGQNVGKSAKQRLLDAGKSMAGETLDQFKQKLQKGSGIPKSKKRKNTLFKVYKTKKRK